MPLVVILPLDMSCHINSLSVKHVSSAMIEARDEHYRKREISSVSYKSTL